LFSSNLPNGHGNFAASDDETCHARSLTPSRREKGLLIALVKTSLNFSAGSLKLPHMIISPYLLADLTTRRSVGIVANMPSQLIARFKNITTDGAILEVVVWKVPAPVPPTEHGYKYRAVYVVDGIRVVGFDNERGKGDHCHLDGKEAPYVFTGVEQLMEDFIAAVATRRKP
jgi:hypothetical protein